jgi:hypothetical protein
VKALVYWNALTLEVEPAFEWVVHAKPPGSYGVLDLASNRVLLMEIACCQGSQQQSRLFSRILPHSNSALWTDLLLDSSFRDNHFVGKWSIYFIGLPPSTPDGMVVF